VLVEAEKSEVREKIAPGSAGTARPAIDPEKFEPKRSKTARGKGGGPDKGFAGTRFDMSQPLNEGARKVFVSGKRDALPFKARRANNWETRRRFFGAAATAAEGFTAGEIFSNRHEKGSVVTG
jgi:hypothetical protein